MKNAIAALALAWGATAAFAQAPASPAAPAAPAVPPAKCEPKPAYPGAKAMQDSMLVEKFQHEMKNYQDCIRAYVAERKAAVEANNAAIRAAVEEHNAIMGKIRTDQEAVTKQQDK